MSFRSIGLLGAVVLLVSSCASEDGEPSNDSMQVFYGARLIDGTGATPIEDAVIVVEDGVIQAVGERNSVEIPEGVTGVDLTGTTIIPGLINAHGHVGDVEGLEAGHYSRENVLAQLGLYARYGITTVVSLGGDGEEGVRVRNEQSTPDLDRARLYVAGPVLDPTTPEEAIEQVEELVALEPDWVKIRVDSNLGRTEKMSPETYTQVIQSAHRNGIPVAAHLVELEDAKGLVRAGVDILAHSVRDVPIDDELLGLLRQNRLCLIPTLTREVSTYVYGSRPDFFDDPFFLREADPAVLDELQAPERMERIRESESAEYWAAQLPLAQENLKTLSDAGVPIAMGTDTGPAGRFQGFFEHMELELMAEAGLTPMQVISAATGVAARCIGLDDEIGTIQPGRHADFVVLEANPLDDIRNTRTIQSVWINGNRVPAADE